MKPPKPVHPERPYGTRGIRLDPGQEAEIDAINDDLRLRFGGKFSFSACVRYLIDLGIRAHRAGRGGMSAPEAAPSASRSVDLRVVAYVSPRKGQPPVRHETGNVFRAPVEAAREATEHGADVLEVVDDSMAPTHRAGEHVLVEPVKSAAVRDVYAVVVGESAMIREVRCDKATATLIPHNIAEYNPIVVPLADLNVIGRVRPIRTS